MSTICRGLVLFIFLGVVDVIAQSPLDKLKLITPLASTKTDTERILGKGEVEDSSTWFYYPDMSIEVIHSSGKCTEGWLAPKGTVVEATVFFFKHRKLSELQSVVDLKRLKYETTFDVVGERHYSDPKKGIRYGVNVDSKEWFSITYFPSAKFSKKRCPD